MLANPTAESFQYAHVLSVYQFSSNNFLVVTHSVAPWLIMCGNFTFSYAMRNLLIFLSGNWKQCISPEVNGKERFRTSAALQRLTVRLSLNDIAYVERTQGVA